MIHKRQPKKRKGMVMAGHHFLLMGVLIYWTAATNGAFAETLEIPANDTKSGFNYSVPYRGQTFMLPEAGEINTITVYATANIFQDFTFHLLLTEVDTTDGFHPTKVLFESGPFYIPVGGSNALIPYTAEVGGVSLSVGQPYAFILDIFVSLSQVTSGSLWEYATMTGMNTGATYSAGNHLYFTSDCSDPWTGLPCGDREDHFAGTWVAETAEDMGFIIEYTPTPAPAFEPVILSPIVFLLLNGN